MPGPAVHNVIGWQLADEFAEQAANDPDNRADLETAARLARTHPAHVALGTQGPDFLFFNVSDWNGAMGTVAREYMTVVEWWDELIFDLKGAIPLYEELSDAGAAVDEAAEENSHTYQEFTRLGRKLSGYLRAFLANVKARVKRWALDQYDVFSLLAHPYQECHDTDEWWWFDTLHYRRTGEFGAGLYAYADRLEGADAERMRAYAIGYLSHVAGDIVGHPYVNTLVRGPYRNHARRHKVIENYQDAWGYAMYHGQEPSTYGRHDAVVRSLLAEEREEGELVDGHFADLTSSRLHYRQLLLTPDSDEYRQLTELPDYIAEAFATVSREVYGGGINAAAGADGSDAPDAEYFYHEDDGDPLSHEGDLTARDVKTAYFHWYKWFRGATTAGTLPPVLPDYEPPTAPIQERWEEFLDDAGDVGDASSNLWDDLKNAWNNGFGGSPDFGGLREFLSKLGEAVVSFALVALQAIDFLLSLPIRWLNDVLDLLLETSYQGLYSAYENFHQLIALLGFGYPLKHQLLRPETRHFVFPSQPDALGVALGDPVPGATDGRWPYPMQAVGKGGAPQYRFDDPEMGALDLSHHLVYPYTNDITSYEERADRDGDGVGDVGAAVGPVQYESEWPAYYIDGRSVRSTDFHPLGASLPPEPDPADLPPRSLRGVDSRLVDLLGTYPADPTALDRLEGLKTPPATAPGLTVELYRRAVDPGTNGAVPNVNLDGDRGFGYGEWVPGECPIDESTALLDLFTGTPSLDDVVTPVPPPEGTWNGQPRPGSDDTDGGSA